MNIPISSDFLQNTVGVLAALTGLIAALIPLWLQLRPSRQSKQLKFEILSDTSLTLTKDFLKETKTITPLTKHQKLISVRIQNTGNKAIVSFDYIEPIRITFNGLVLSSAIIEKSVSIPSLEPISIDRDTVTLPAIPLRPKKSITLNTLLSGDQSGITIKGVIANGQILMAEPVTQSFPASWGLSESSH